MFSVTCVEMLPSQSKLRFYCDWRPRVLSKFHSHLVSIVTATGYLRFDISKGKVTLVSTSHLIFAPVRTH